MWPGDDSAEPDVEIINAITSRHGDDPRSMLICASSPYARRGALFNAHKRHFGKDNDPVLIWQAPTRSMNPRVPQRVIDEAMESDPADIRRNTTRNSATTLRASLIDKTSKRALHSAFMSVHHSPKSPTPHSAIHRAAAPSP